MSVRSHVITIVLAPDQERLVQEKIARGEYPDSTALVREAIQRLLDGDELESIERAEIRSALARADAEIDGGEFVEFEADEIGQLAEQVHARGLRQLSKIAE